MGAGVSTWKLARSVAAKGQIGVVSGTALDLIMARRLELGDPGGHMRRALDAFPYADVSRRIMDRYFVPGGKSPDNPFSAKPMVGRKRSRHVDELLIAANFAEVFLAKEGHRGIVGINYLHKIECPLLPSLYGAMLARVDAVIVGAGIPIEIPRIIDGLTRGEPVELSLPVRDGGGGQSYKLEFDPERVLAEPTLVLPRPRFYPIVSSVLLATIMAKKCRGRVDGLIVEGPTAGGHNAPPRVKGDLSPQGEPVYGPRDVIDLAAVSAIGLPFWLAGSYGRPAQLRNARAAGAAGVQVGTLFAFCEESGLRDDLKRDVIAHCSDDTRRVFTDAVASPTGYPFKVLPIPGTLSDEDEYKKRQRVCDLGYLREAFERSDGKLGWRCAAEELDIYGRKRGDGKDTHGKKCLCNALMANIGMAQVRRDNQRELPLVTCGDEVSSIRYVAGASKKSYKASDVIDYLLS